VCRDGPPIEARVVPPAVDRSVPALAQSSRLDLTGPRRRWWPGASAGARSVLVDVVAVLEVAVAIVDVVNVIAVGHHVAAVRLGVSAFVAGVQGLLGVALAAVHVVDMVAVPDGRAPVPRMMLVIGGLSMGRHLSSLAATRSAPAGRETAAGVGRLVQVPDLMAGADKTVCSV
jgi:hypothetical protein